MCICIHKIGNGLSGDAEVGWTFHPAHGKYKQDDYWRWFTLIHWESDTKHGGILHPDSNLVKAILQVNLHILVPPPGVGAGAGAEAGPVVNGVLVSI